LFTSLPICLAIPVHCPLGGLPRLTALRCPFSFASWFFSSVVSSPAVRAFAPPFPPRLRAALCSSLALFRLFPPVGYFWLPPLPFCGPLGFRPLRFPFSRLFCRVVCGVARVHLRAPSRPCACSSSSPGSSVLLVRLAELLLLVALRRPVRFTPQFSLRFAVLLRCSFCTGLLNACCLAPSLDWFSFFFVGRLLPRSFFLFSLGRLVRSGLFSASAFFLSPFSLDFALAQRVLLGDCRASSLSACFLCRLAFRPLALAPRGAFFLGSFRSAFAAAHPSVQPVSRSSTFAGFLSALVGHVFFSACGFSAILLASFPYVSVPPALLPSLFLFFACLPLLVTASFLFCRSRLLRVRPRRPLRLPFPAVCP